MSILGLPSGKEIGKIKEELLKKQIEGLIKNKKEAIDFVKKYIEKLKG